MIASIGLYKLPIKIEYKFFWNECYILHLDNSFKVFLYFLLVLSKASAHFSNSGLYGVKVKPSFFSITCSSSPSFKLYFSIISFGTVNPKLFPTLRNLIDFIFITSVIL